VTGVSEEVVVGESPRVENLRRLALGDERTIHRILTLNGYPPDGIDLSGRDCALFQIAAFVASPPSAASYKWAVTTALAQGATDDEIIAVLVSVAPVIGSARLTVAAHALAAALGYEIDPLTEP
jgi:hypothetical protein